VVTNHFSHTEKETNIKIGSEDRTCVGYKSSSAGKINNLYSGAMTTNLISVGELVTLSEKECRNKLPSYSQRLTSYHYPEECEAKGPRAIPYYIYIKKRKDTFIEDE